MQFIGTDAITIYQDEADRHCWGHVSSLDLLHWRHHKPWLTPTDDSPETGILSGNCFINKEGQATMHYRAFNYGYPPEPTRESLLYDAFGRSNWKVEAFYKDLEKAEEAGLMPTLLIGKPDINLDSGEASAVFAAAKRFRDKLHPKGIPES